MCHVTYDMWHTTCDMFWGTNILSKFHLPSSYYLQFMILLRFRGKGSLPACLNESIYEAVCRPAPATPGQLTITAMRSPIIITSSPRRPLSGGWRGPGGSRWRPLLQPPSSARCPAIPSAAPRNRTGGRPGRRSRRPGGCKPAITVGILVSLLGCPLVGLV